MEGTQRRRTQVDSGDNLPPLVSEREKDLLDITVQTRFPEILVFVSGEYLFEPGDVIAKIPVINMTALSQNGAEEMIFRKKGRFELRAKGEESKKDDLLGLADSGGYNEIDRGLVADDKRNFRHRRPEIDGVAKPDFQSAVLIIIGDAFLFRVDGKALEKRKDEGVLIGEERSSQRPEAVLHGCLEKRELTLNGLGLSTQHVQVFREIMRLEKAGQKD